jgi:hypothetical protein
MLTCALCKIRGCAPITGTANTADAHIAKPLTGAPTPTPQDRAQPMVNPSLAAETPVLKVAFVRGVTQDHPEWRQTPH